jgi:hypothetical protein
MFDKYLTHQPRGDAEKMSATAALHLAAVCEPQIGFVYEGCGLEGVVESLAAQMSARQSAEFVIDQRNQTVKRLSVSFAPVAEHFGQSI